MKYAGADTLPSAAFALQSFSIRLQHLSKAYICIHGCVKLSQFYRLFCLILCRWTFGLWCEHSAPAERHVGAVTDRCCRKRFKTHRFNRFSHNLLQCAHSDFWST